MEREELVNMCAYKIAQASGEYYHNGNEKTDAMSAFEDGAEWAYDHPENLWKLTKYDLPDDMKPVNMVVEINGSKFLMIGHYDAKLKCWSTRGNVIKWMYIPNEEGLIYKIG